MSEQLLLELVFPEQMPDEKDLDHELSLRHGAVRRAAVAWLVGCGVAGLATRVPTRRTKFAADVAGFWNLGKRNRSSIGPRQLLVPCRTCIIECRTSRADCWPDCSDSTELLPQLRDLRREALEMQTEIRLREPHLREPGTLFEEYSEWNYARSASRSYQDLRRRIEKFEMALYDGTRFESMRNCGLADLLYLAVPEKTVHPHELADGWGLLWVDKQLHVTPIKQAKEQRSPPENRFHLVQNIAASARAHVLFAHGIDARSDGCSFRPLPRRRHRRRTTEPSA